MSYPQQSNFMFFGSNSGTNDNTLAQAQAMSAGAYQHGHLGMASDGASAAAAAAAAVAAAAGGNGGVNAYFVNNGHALMAAAAAGHAGMYPASIVDTHQHQHQRSGSLSSATLAAAATGGAIGADHRRSPSGSLRSGANNAEHAQRRATHNAIERARRESLNGQFQDLASAVPALNSVRRPSKATIVEKSLEHIKSFRSKIEARDQCISRLQMRNLALHNEVNRLRNQLGLEPFDNDSEELIPETISEAPEDQLAASSSQNISTPAASRGALLQPNPVSPNPHKRRQQSLDLGAISVASASRPVLRVQTSNISKRKQQAVAASTAQMSQAMLTPAAMATTSSAVGGDYYSSSSAGGGASPMSSSASPLNISPLSAPILSRASASQFPFSTMQATSTAAVVAAAAAAMQQQLLSTDIVTTMTQQQQQQHGITTTAGGYTMMPQPAAASLGLIDMNNLSDVFAANNSADPASAAATAGMISVSMPISTSALASNSSSPGITTLEGKPC